MAGVRIGGVAAGGSSPPYSVWDDAFIYNVWRVLNGVPTNITQFGSPEGDNSIQNPVLSPDGTMIAYGQNNGGGGTFSQLYVIPAGGGTPVLLDDGGDVSEVLHPNWRPDSGKIIYTIGNTSGDFYGENIYEINPDGTGKNLLYTTAGGGDGFVRPQYNRDGTLIAFLRADFDPTQTSPELWVMDADGTNDSLVVAIDVVTQEGSQFAFANTSDRLAYSAGGTGDAFTIDPDGTDQTQINTVSGVASLIKRTSWAPDDSYLIGGGLRDDGGMIFPPEWVAIKFDPAGGGETVLNYGEGAVNAVDKRGVFLYRGRIYYLQAPPTNPVGALVSIAAPDGGSYRQDHVLADTGASDWSGTSGIEYL